MSAEGGGAAPGPPGGRAGRPGGMKREGPDGRREECGCLFFSSLLFVSLAFRLSTCVSRLPALKSFTVPSNHTKSTMASPADMACVYAALALADDEVEITVRVKGGERDARENRQGPRSRAVGAPAPPLLPSTHSMGAYAMSLALLWRGEEGVLPLWAAPGRPVLGPLPKTAARRGLPWPRGIWTPCRFPDFSDSHPGR